ncbi:MAG TPA: MBL fold metallo-hydrolase [Polyangiaceae bacterium]|nr:MBL fold metallo-hydrolase [Polyangiaceae bacterium]
MEASTKFETRIHEGGVPRSPLRGRSWLQGAALLLGLQLLAVLCLILLAPLKEWQLQLAIPTDYFEPQLDAADEFEQVRGPLHAFRHGIDRSLVLDAGEALAVFDTYNPEHSRRLRAELQHRFPGKPVRWVFYSHHHLDHIQGAAELQPVEVIAHERVMGYVADWPDAQVLPVTRALKGDASLQLGAVPVQLLYLGQSHTDTLYAFHFPEQGALFAPDAAFLRSLPPFGLPDYYYPGYLRALDRLAALEFELCIPAHFSRGTKADLLQYRQLMIDFRQASAALVADMGGDPSRGAGQRARIGAAYRSLQQKYGDWHGFDAMFIPHFLGGIGGAYLGF